MVVLIALGCWHSFSGRSKYRFNSAYGRSGHACIVIRRLVSAIPISISERSEYFSQNFPSNADYGYMPNKKVKGKYPHPKRKRLTR